MVTETILEGQVRTRGFGGHAVRRSYRDKLLVSARHDRFPKPLLRHVQLDSGQGCVPGTGSDLRPKCGGLWLERGEITRAAKLPENELARLRAMLAGSSGPPPIPTENKAPCPACPGTLAEVLLGAMHVDYCAACHGLFLDRGELRMRWRRCRPATVKPSRTTSSSPSRPSQARPAQSVAARGLLNLTRRPARARPRRKTRPLGRAPRRKPAGRGEPWRRRPDRAPPNRGAPPRGAAFEPRPGRRPGGSP